MSLDAQFQIVLFITKHSFFILHDRILLLKLGFSHLQIFCPDGCIVISETRMR